MPHSVPPHSPSEHSLARPPLLRLPWEIRELIYRYALTRDQAFLWPSEDLTYKLSPALLATCRQIHDEATPILYKLNRFSFKHPSDCNVFCHIMSREHIKEIPKVGFHIREKDISLFVPYFGSTDPVRSLTYDLPDLQYLIVFLTQTWQPNRDPDEAIKMWAQSNAVRKICMSLEARTKAEVTVLCSIRISEMIFSHLKRTHPEVLVLVGPGHMRTKQVVIHQARVMLELLCSHAGSHGATE